MQHPTFISLYEPKAYDSNVAAALRKCKKQVSPPPTSLLPSPSASASASSASGSGSARGGGGGGGGSRAGLPRRLKHLLKFMVLVSVAYLGMMVVEQELDRRRTFPVEAISWEPMGQVWLAKERQQII